MGDKLGDGFEAGKELMKGLKQTDEAGSHN